LLLTTTTTTTTSTAHTQPDIFSITVTADTIGVKLKYFTSNFNTDTYTHVPFLRSL